MSFADPARAPFQAEVRVPVDQAARLDASLNAFVPTAAVAAAVLGEDLHVDGPVDPVLLESAGAVGERIAARDGGRAPALTAVGATAASPVAAERWLLFTGGIDSTHSLLSLRPELDRLIYVAGLDPMWDERVHAQVLASTEEAAAFAGLPLVACGSNLRELVDPLIGFIESHHAVLASAMLALGRGIGTAYAAGGTSLYTPLWDAIATSSTRFLLHDHAVPRGEKAANVAGAPGWPERLKVCYAAGVAGNCGRCPKCVSTMVYLLAAHGDERAISAFPTRLDEALVDEAAGPVAELAIRLPTLMPAYVAAGLPVLLERLPERYLGVRDRFLDHFASFFPTVAVRLQGGDDPPTGLDATARARAAIPAWKGPHRLDVGWEDGRLPLRPSESGADDVRRSCREPRRRPVPWAVIGTDEQADARLIDRLLTAWGQGVVHAWHPAPGAGLEPEVASSLLRASRIRVWRGDSSGLLAGPLLAALENGCLPLQALSPRDYAELAPRLPAGLEAALLPLDGAGVQVLDEVEAATRLDRILEVVLAGTLERDLAIARG